MENLINLESLPGLENLNPENLIPPEAMEQVTSLFSPEGLTTIIIPVVVGLLVLKFLLSQIGCAVKVAIHVASGFACLWLLNLAAVYTGITIEINLVTVLIAGFAGIPGIILLVLKQFMETAKKIPPGIREGFLLHISP